MALRMWRLTIAVAGAALAIGCFDREMPERAEAVCANGFTGECWQMISTDEMLGWSAAVDYCDGMELGGYAWHLPSIDELRSLVSGCDETETGGSCGVTEGCLDSGTCQTGECAGCGFWGGLGYGGCYWGSGLGGGCTCYWSSSVFADNPLNAWAVGFDKGEVRGYGKETPCYVRCLADE